MMRAETASDYIDMSEDSFLEYVAPFLDNIVVEETAYFLREDLEFVIRMFFKAPSDDNVTKLHPVK
jgi:hypothetical protein